MATPYLQYGQDGLSGFDANGVRRIWLDPLNLLFSFFDANGIPRCEIGNLPARGVATLGIPISQAHWGFRVNDATGNPIYDSIGVIQAMSQPGGSVQITPSGTSSLTPVTVTGSTLTIPYLSRPVTFLVQCNFTAALNSPGGAGTYGYVGLVVDGVSLGRDTSGNYYNVFTKGTGGAIVYTNGSFMYSAALGVGAHTINLNYYVDDVANSLAFNRGGLFAFQLGN